MRSLILALLAFSSAALAVPTQIGHQGRVLDAEGIPAEGPHTLEFRLYDAATDGAVLWIEVHEVDLTNGYYSLVLGEDGVGEALDLDLFRDYELFLELAVDEGEALSPRQAMNAVPYARQAEHAASLSGGMVFLKVK